MLGALGVATFTITSPPLPAATYASDPTSRISCPETSAGAAIPNLTYVVEETPGLSNARNVAARLIRAPIIAFMDDDAIASAMCRSSAPIPGYAPAVSINEMIGNPNLSAMRIRRPQRRASDSS